MAQDMRDTEFHMRDHSFNSQITRGRASSIPLPTLCITPAHSPSSRASTSHVRSSSEGAVASPRTRLINRVKFTVDGDTSQSHQFQETQNGSDIERNLLQIPPVAYCQQQPDGEAMEEQHAEMSDDLPGFYSPQPYSGGSTPVSVCGSVGSRVNLVDHDEMHGQGDGDKKGRALHGAYERAQRLAASVIHRHPSQINERGGGSHKVSRRRRHDADSASEKGDAESYDNLDMLEKQAYISDSDNSDDSQFEAEAAELFRGMSRQDSHSLTRVLARSDDLASGHSTPYADRDPDVYVSRPSHYRGGILSSLLRIYTGRETEQLERKDIKYPSLQPPSRALSPIRRNSGRPQRQKWYNNKSASQSMCSLNPASPQGGLRQQSPAGRQMSSGGVYNLVKKCKTSSKPRLEEEIRLTVHIAETLARQRYLVKLCRALMWSGAPTHRLEEYMRMTARVLEIDGQFLYIPGVMVMAFDDNTTHVTEVKLIKSSQHVNLGRLRDIQVVYKEVIHDVIGVEEAMQRLDEITKAQPKFGVRWLIPLYGCASALVGPFAFGARPIDMPLCFVLGCIVALLQHVLAPRSENYANVFEVSAAVITSFLARALGSIEIRNGEHLFCFAALAQSSIVLILPGYIVLCGSLELQSRNIIAGSVRMVYAIIYSLFLGFGIMLGTAFYGLLDREATLDFVCPASPIKNEYIQRFPFVIVYAICSCLIYQAKYKQIPIMVAIAFTGYLVSFFSARRFVSTQLSSALGAFAIGVLGNLYSRLRHGLAAAAILPAIFLQLPSGLATSGSLVSSLIVATTIKGDTTSSKPLGTVANDWIVKTAMSPSTSKGLNDLMRHIMLQRFLGNVVFDIAYGMLEVAIGITVGLFMAALVIYPFGKRRSGLFSF
ncbi:hypothetical protein PABG_01018 [Paracoccidioides brasiliensis Pb03]|nr:hypothetical protein PABG_01018 [Paracoccidioides brasiliensis Pb03]